MCDNPWAEEKCTKQDVELYIIVKGKQIAICHECWPKIADKDLEWGDDPAIAKFKKDYEAMDSRTPENSEHTESSN